MVRAREMSDAREVIGGLLRRRIQERARRALAGRIGDADVQRVVERSSDPWAIHPLAAAGIVFVTGGKVIYARRQLALGVIGGEMEVIELAPEAARVVSVGTMRGAKSTWVEVEIDGGATLLLGGDVALTTVGAEAATRELVHVLGSVLPCAPGVKDRDEPPIEVPLLIVERHVPEPIRTVPWLPVVAYSSILVTIVTAVIRHEYALRFVPRVAVFGPAALLIATSVMARAWLRSRHARAAFFDDRVSIRRGTTVVVRWTSLDGYWDGNADYVRLVRKGERVMSTDLIVPTPSDDVRAAVLKVLDEKGLKRV